MASFLHTLRQAREYLSPQLRESKFRESGVLTPEEFIAAGDYLVLKCPSWSWSAGIDSKLRDYMPADKQYLITRNVPCATRIKDMEYEDLESEKNIDGFTLTHVGRKVVTDEEIEEIGAGINHVSIAPDANTNPEAEIPAQEDIDSEFVLDEIDQDIAALGNNNVVLTRTYDMTPRIWLYGYDEYRNPLTSHEIFEDISEDHAKKTVTIEPHPHESVSHASIHPCKHANVMQKIILSMEEGGRTELRVDQYLVVFLKFMTAVLPTMDFDYSHEA